MGSGASKPARQGRRRQRQHAVPVIGAPQGIQIHIPRNRIGQQGVLVQQVTRDIDNDTLLAALNHVSTYMAQRGQHVSVVAVGGAVNTLYLRSRIMTHDVDVFGSDFTNQARILIDEAMQDAQKHYANLGTDWLNTETQMWMTGPMHEALTIAAKAQNIKVFEGAGLTIYAAPWNYAFSAKVSRILTGGDQVRAYDLQDAITYIHEYIRGHGNQPVPVAMALKWANDYHHQSNTSILRNKVNKEYRKRYGANAFV